MRSVVDEVRGRQVVACSDEHSLWVEVCGPKGGAAWQMTPALADRLAAALIEAARRARADDPSAPAGGDVSR